MTTKQKVYAKAKELGIEINETGERYRAIELIAPKGKKFAGFDLHICVSEQDDWTTAAQLWQNVWEDIRMGLSECEDADCEVCLDA